MKSVFSFFVGTLFLSSIAFAAQPDWMKNIPDSTSINDLTIPGTHDTATYKTEVPFARTQSRTLEEQLEMGVRFLDIRARATNGSLAIHHGDIFLNMMMGDVLKVCRNFLTAHPTETIIMSVKEDKDGYGKSFKEAFKDYYNSNPDLWYKDPAFPNPNNFPTIGAVRGKIVLLLRQGFAADSDLGFYFNIGDNKTGCINITNYKEACTNSSDGRPSTLQIRYEDLYSPDNDDAKVKAILANLDSGRFSLNNLEKTWHVTFTSANKPPKGPEYYAKEGSLDIIGVHAKEWVNINGKMKYWFDRYYLTPVGIVAIDFVNQEVVDRMIRSNFPPKNPDGTLANGDTMKPGQVLTRRGYLTSKNGRYRLIYQGNGDLVLYDHLKNGGADKGGPTKALWAAQTADRRRGVCYMEPDGSLVIYNRGLAIWAKRATAGSRLVVQDDGNVVCYRSDGHVEWATNTVQK